MIQFSAFADEVSADFREQVKFLVAQQIPAIEIRFVNQKNIMDLNSNELVEVKNILTDNGIGVSAVGSPIGKVKINEPFDQHFDKFKHAVEIAYFLNTSMIRVFSYYPPEGKNIVVYREEVLERMSKKASFLNGTNIKMVHENESHIFGHSAQNCVDIVKSVNSNHLKLAYDPANFVWGDDITNNMEVCWPLMKPYVVHVHIKDWKLGSKDIGSMPGEGDGQIRELLKELAEIDYKGFITMEPHLRTGGQFGGDTGPELFEQAIHATKALFNDVGLRYN